MKLKRNIIVILLGFILLEAIIFVTVTQYNNQKIEKIKASNIKRLDTELKSIIYFNQQFSTMAIEEILNQNSIKELLKNINSKDTKVQKTTREELQKNLSSTYNRFINHGFRQLHFHDKDGNSFLRFHSLNDFGDNILDVRATVKLANQTKKAQFGFEEGKVLNGFRNVFPIFIDNEFYGTVELSNSFDTIHHYLHKIYPYEYKLIISKEYVDKKAFKEKIDEYYTISSVNSDFYEEKVQDCDTEIFSQRVLSKIDAQIKELFRHQLKEFKEFAQNVKVDDSLYLVTFLPIVDFDKTINAYLISYEKNDILNKTKQEIFSTIITLNLILSLIFILYILRINYMEKNIFIKKAYTDTLTKLYNRTKFNVDLDHIIKENRLKKYSVIMYDIDFFKKVNDTYGHDVGDIVLKEFSMVTKQAIRNTDLVYRWGGEEFIAIIETTSKEDLLKVSEKMRVAVENFNFTKIGKLTSSFGVAIATKNETKDSLIKRADENLYKAKQTGRNKIVI